MDWGRPVLDGSGNDHLVNGILSCVLNTSPCGQIILNGGAGP
jgi:hypothetical protein